MAGRGSQGIPTGNPLQQKPIAPIGQAKSKPVGASPAAQSGFSPPPPSLKLPRLHRFTLRNGVKLILAEHNRAPVLSIRVQIRGGTVQDSPDRAGVAALAASLLSAGTENRTARQIAIDLDGLAAALTSLASEDAIEMGLETLARSGRSAANLLADLIRESTYPPEELERQRKLALARLTALNDEPGLLADRAAMGQAFSEHLYGMQPRASTLQAIGRDEVIAAARQSVAPVNTTIICAGAVPVETQVQWFKAAFESWQRDVPGSTLVLVPSNRVRSVLLVDRAELDQTHLRWTGLTPQGSRPDRLACRVAASILGGGFISRLVKEVRVRRSLTYEITAQFASLVRSGYFQVSTYTKNSSVRETITAVEAVLMQAATQGISMGELDSAKGFLSGQFASAMQGSSALADRVADLHLHGLPESDLSDYFGRLRALSLAEVNEVVRRYCDPKRLSLTAVGPGKAIQTQLKGSGQVKAVSSKSILE